MDMRVFDAFLV